LVDTLIAELGVTPDAVAGEGVAVGAAVLVTVVPVVVVVFALVPLKRLLRMPAEAVPGRIAALRAMAAAVVPTIDPDLRSGMWDS
jgi:hypothetical protein